MWRRPCLRLRVQRNVRWLCPWYDEDTTVSRVQSLARPPREPATTYQHARPPDEHPGFSGECSASRHSPRNTPSACRPGDAAQSHRGRAARLGGAPSVAHPPRHYPSTTPPSRIRVRCVRSFLTRISRSCSRILSREIQPNRTAALTPSWPPRRRPIAIIAAASRPM